MSDEKPYYKLKEIIGDKKNGVDPLLPVSRSTFLKGIKKGVYPPPVKLSPKVLAWWAQDIKALVAGEWGVKA